MNHGRLPKSRVDSTGHRNTGSKSSNRNLKSYIRHRALIQTENTVLFRFNWVQLGKIGSLREVLSDQPISWCCIDRLSWHRFSGATGGSARHCARVRPGLKSSIWTLELASVWPGV